jgi:6-phosphogluconolactonase
VSPASDLPGRVHLEPDPLEVAVAAASWLVDRERDAAAARGVFHVGLAGGSTPKLMYVVLRGTPMRDEAAWERWQVWFGDERAVPGDDESSNHHLARTLFDHVPIPAANIHRMPGERPDLAAAAAEYAALMERELPAGPGGAPRLDALLLGLGENGHTASLFPGDPSLDVDDRWVVASRADYEPYDRLTLTFPTINAAAAVAFAVTGGSKAGAFRGVRAGTAPAARVRPADGELHWFLDAAAGATVP